jgi:hypothetical protein
MEEAQNNFLTSKLMSFQEKSLPRARESPVLHFAVETATIIERAVSAIAPETQNQTSITTSNLRSH